MKDADVFETFKHNIGDLVTLKCNPNIAMTVVERKLIQCPTGITRAYYLRGVGSQGTVCEFELSELRPEFKLADED